ncbi:AAA family ATPase [Photobacterium leiognathi]|uniref:AAA family ATPase n=1 Tax=Photobacterium leiognathi TaxID=553611 RepID=UPI0029820903|nr:hypothetical protein [Photobacterium leiognathi]
MKSIRVRNLRSFGNNESEPFIDIKPITVFVGKNSCGKSSLLRTFPLLRQSIEANTSGPLLWFGQYVDFGAFSEAKNKFNKENSIYFDFKLDISKHPEINSIRSNLKQGKLPLTISLEFIEKNKRTELKSSTIYINDLNFHIDYSNNIIYLDGIETQYKDFFSFQISGTLLPYLEALPFSSEDLFDFEKEDLKRNLNFTDEDLDNIIIDIHDSYENCKALSRKHILSIYRLLNTNYSNFIDFESKYLQDISFMDKELLIDKIEDTFNITIENDNIKNELFKINTICFLPELTYHIDKIFKSYVNGVKYIAPLRATAQRFYRFQDLRVSEIDPEGTNLAMLIRNLEPSYMKKFQSWCEENFGFIISVPETNSLHYEITITIDGQTQNISDMGFGFSQILPIVTSLWFETNKDS